MYRTFSGPRSRLEAARHTLNNTAYDSGVWQVVDLTMVRPPFALHYAVPGLLRNVRRMIIPTTWRLPLVRTPRLPVIQVFPEREEDDAEEFRQLQWDLEENLHPHIPDDIDGPVCRPVLLVGSSMSIGCAELVGRVMAERGLLSWRRPALATRDREYALRDERYSFREMFRRRTLVPVLPRYTPVRHPLVHHRSLLTGRLRKLNTTCLPRA